MGKAGGKWYAVRVGRRPGIYRSWPECQSQVKGFSGAIFKSFSTPEEAHSWAEGASSTPAAASSNTLAPRKKQLKEKQPAHSTSGNAPRMFRTPEQQRRREQFRSAAATTRSPSRNAPRRTAAHCIDVRATKRDIASSSDDVGAPSGEMRPCKSVVMYFDGGARHNPGPAGCGAAIFASGSTASAPLATSSAFLGTATNNEAEYEGLILGLRLALRHGASEVTIHGDSMLVLNHLQGVWMARKERLVALLELTQKTLLPQFKTWHVKHVFRASNKIADSLANEAMDYGARGAVASLPSTYNW